MCGACAHVRGRQYVSGAVLEVTRFTRSVWRAIRLTASAAQSKAGGFFFLFFFFKKRKKQTEKKEGTEINKFKK